MVENSGLGQLPRIVFVMDTSYIYSAHVDRLFDKLNVGPDTETEDDLLEQVEMLELGSDGGGLRRDEILKKVEMVLLKSEAKHRQLYSAEQFQEVYRETMARHGGEHKMVLLKSEAKHRQLYSAEQ